ncbi:MAG: discoidin domain-containing protein, partial [Nitrospirae bacterium]|nr:discoidin domain-containing protein [Nitrospirota bacterium]
TPNIAYGKKSMLVYDDPLLHWADLERDYYYSRIVDGYTSKCSGFISRMHENPAWILDLSRLRDIETIVLHEGCPKTAAIEGALNWLNDLEMCSDKEVQNSSVNVRPLNIALSNDGTKWTSVTSLVSPINNNGPTRIVFDGPQAARYIRIKATGASKLLFDEVEVYGPSDAEERR